MDTSLSPAVQTVYQTMQIFAQGNHICNASYNMLAQKSGYCKTIVINAIISMQKSHQLHPK